MQSSDSANPSGVMSATDIRTSADELSLLLDVSRMLSSELDLDRLLHTIVARTSKSLDAERATLFLVDEAKAELWSRVAEGEGVNEIRIPRDTGIAGNVSLTGQAVNTEDAYKHPWFSPEVDRTTGYRTGSVLCMPVRDASSRIIGVLEVLNKVRGPFTSRDQEALEGLCNHVAIALGTALVLEARRKEMEKSDILLDVMRSLSSELELDQLLALIMDKTTEVMQADRSSLFIVDHETKELWFKVAQGTDLQEVRIPIGVGIAGHVAATGEILNLADVYADPRFNQEMDRRTGYHTKNMLCMPMRDNDGKIVGVLQVLNKKQGLFTREDEELLEAVGSQAVIAIENAQLFESVVRMKNYNESVLYSMANGVITLSMDGKLSTANPAAERILGFTDGAPVGSAVGPAINGEQNPEVWDIIERALEQGESAQAEKLRYSTATGGLVIMNLSAVPLLDHKAAQIGVVAVIEDISREQQLRGTLTRVVSRQVAEQLIASGEVPEIGGERKEVTVLMSDIRDFTPFSESTEPEEVIAMLNDYFGRMIDIVFKYEGTLDKFIGDAIMAVFGTPARHEDDPVRAVMAGIDMRKALRTFNDDRRAAGKSTIEIGIGICNGEAVSGAIGSEERLEFTVIGDTVNTAARLEGLTKGFPNHKLVFNEAVYEEVKNLVSCDFLAEEYVTGKSQPVRIYGIPESAIEDPD